MTIFQGIIAGSAAACLAAPEKKHTCTRVAVQANHALLLAAETIRFAGTPLGEFGTAVKILGAMVPLAIGVDFYQKEPVLSEKQMSLISKVYQASVIISSVATLVLGNPVFAIGTISVLTLDALLDEKNELFSFAKKVGGFIALIGYGAMSAAAEGVLAGLNTLSAVLIGGESLSKIDWKAARDPQSTSGDQMYIVDSSSSPSYVDPCYASPVTNAANPTFKDLGNLVCRPGVWED